MATGSSPLARGKLVRLESNGYPVGLIPARAGKTATRLSRMLSLRAHPRSRGENQRLPLLTPVEEGSSPLARGKLPKWVRACASRGLIPARAGKTGVYGGASQTMSGSSPLARGKPRQDKGRGSHRGLIPARAGKTSHHDLSKVRTWAHPRSRGENALSRAFTASTAGSSPLARGKPPRAFYPPS